MKVLITLFLTIQSFVFSSCYNPALALQLCYMSAVAYFQSDSIDTWSCSMCKHYQIQSVISFYNKSVQGFIGYQPNNNAIFLVFRGSANIINFITDFDSKMQAYDGCQNCTVHSGIIGGYQQLQEIMHIRVREMINKYSSAKIYTTGHSLGGAFATLAGIEIKKAYGKLEEVISFGSPRVGNPSFAKFASAYLKGDRVVNFADIVPHLPASSLGFVHGMKQAWYQKGMQSYQQCDPESPQCVNSIHTISYSIPDHDIMKYLKLKVAELRVSQSGSLWDGRKSRANGFTKYLTKLTRLLSDE